MYSKANFCVMKESCNKSCKGKLFHGKVGNSTLLIQTPLVTTKTDSCFHMGLLLLYYHNCNNNIS